MQKTAQMMLEMGTNPPLSAAEFEQIATPVLLTIGDKDQMVSIDETRHMTHLLPHAQCIVHKEVPHSIEQMDAAFLAQSIHNFFWLFSHELNEFECLSDGFDVLKSN